MRNGASSSGIALLLLLAVAALTLALAAHPIEGAETWAQAAVSLASSLLMVLAGILLISLVVAAVQFLDMATRYNSDSLFEEKNGELFLGISRQRRKILAYRIMQDKIVLMFAHGSRGLGRRSFYRADKALIAISRLLEDEYDIPELAVDDEAFHQTVAALQEIGALARSGKHPPTSHHAIGDRDRYSMERQDRGRARAASTGLQGSHGR